MIFVARHVIIDYSLVNELGLKMSDLHIDYHFNKKAWMTSSIFTDWLKRLNNSITILSRKILLFVDNCSAHPPMQLSHVKVVMLPPNTTSCLQPCDAGVIKAVKLHYRRYLLRHLLSEMEQDQT